MRLKENALCHDFKSGGLDDEAALSFMQLQTSAKLAIARWFYFIFGMYRPTTEEQQQFMPCWGDIKYC